MRRNAILGPHLYEHLTGQNSPTTCSSLNSRFSTGAITCYPWFAPHTLRIARGYQYAPRLSSNQALELWKQTWRRRDFSIRKQSTTSLRVGLIRIPRALFGSSCLVHHRGSYSPFVVVIRSRYRWGAPQCGYRKCGCKSCRDARRGLGAHKREEALAMLPSQGADGRGNFNARPCFNAG